MHLQAISDCLFSCLMMDERWEPPSWDLSQDRGLKIGCWLSVWEIVKPLIIYKTSPFFPLWSSCFVWRKERKTRDSIRRCFFPLRRRGRTDWGMTARPKKGCKVAQLLTTILIIYCRMFGHAFFIRFATVSEGSAPLLIHFSTDSALICASLVRGLYQPSSCTSSKGKGNDF